MDDLFSQHLDQALSGDLLMPAPPPEKWLKTKGEVEAWIMIQQQIEHFRITRDTQMAAMRFLLEYQGVRLFPRGDLVCFTGKEKCGKTTDCRIIVSALLRGEYMGFRALEQGVRILWIDSEQARISTRAICRGVDKMCCFEADDTRMRYYNLREWEDRGSMRMLLQVLFNEFRPDLCILDGIRDFIHDFNDVRESSEIVLEAMRLSSGVDAARAEQTGLVERPACSIVCILHQNKPKDDNNMRGHLGTELANKSGSIWEALQDEGHVFTFREVRTRYRPLDTPIYYRVHTEYYTDPNDGSQEELGIPEVCDAPVEAEVKGKRPEPVVIEQRQPQLVICQQNARIMIYRELSDAPALFDTIRSACIQRYGIDYMQFSKLWSFVRVVDVAQEKSGQPYRWIGVPPSADEELIYM